MNIPHILILDNDETTGSYYLLFSLYDFLSRSTFNGKINAAKTLKLLLKILEQNDVFRPGLRAFLHDMYLLKKQGHLNNICIYTNQLDVRYVNGYKLLKTSDGKEWSVPEILRTMFNMIVKDPWFIDAVYTRPNTNVNLAEDYPIKDFVRVFDDLYPDRRVDLSYTAFVDDRFHRKYIVDSSQSGTDSRSRIPIDPYMIVLPRNVFYDTIEQIAEINNLNMVENMSLIKKCEKEWLLTNKKVGLMEKEVSNSNMKSFTDLSDLTHYLTNLYLSKDSVSNNSQTRKNGKKWRSNNTSRTKSKKRSNTRGY